MKIFISIINFYGRHEKKNVEKSNKMCIDNENDSYIKGTALDWA